MFAPRHKDEIADFLVSRWGHAVQPGRLVARAGGARQPVHAPVAFGHTIPRAAIRLAWHGLPVRTSQSVEFVQRVLQLILQACGMLALICKRAPKIFQFTVNAPQVLLGHIVVRRAKEQDRRQTMACISPFVRPKWKSENSGGRDGGYQAAEASTGFHSGLR
jgi:hypothetical protein